MFQWKTVRSEVEEILAAHVARHLIKPQELFSDATRADIRYRATGAVQLGIISDRKVTQDMEMVDADGAEAMLEEAMSSIENQLIACGFEILPHVKMSRPKLFTSLATLDEAEEFDGES